MSCYSIWELQLPCTCSYCGFNNSLLMLHFLEWMRDKKKNDRTISPYGSILFFPRKSSLILFIHRPKRRINQYQIWFWHWGEGIYVFIFIFVDGLVYLVYGKLPKDNSWKDIEDIWGQLPISTHVNWIWARPCGVLKTLRYGAVSVFDNIRKCDTPKGLVTFNEPMRLFRLFLLKP